MTNDLYAQAVEAIYAGMSGGDGVEQTLQVLATTLRARGATFEVIDKAALRPLAFHSVGLPPTEGADYLAHFAALNPRLPATLAQRRGGLTWDYQLIDEGAMKRDPFYAEFLARAGLRYFLSAVLDNTRERLTVVTLQRTPREGHVVRKEIALMQRLGPHLQRAHQLKARLDAHWTRGLMLEHALDLLGDGVALLRRDGSPVHVNATLRLLAERESGLRIGARGFEFGSAELRRRFAMALRSVDTITEPGAAAAALDFAVPRDHGLPPYTISLRPLRAGDDRIAHADAVALLLVHDPVQGQGPAARLLQELYGLTPAEAHLVQALSGGMTAVAYAKSRQVSITTVYTHLRRTRQKTGWRSVAELTRRFHELSVSLRPN